MDMEGLNLPVPDPRINPAVYYFLPPKEAKYQLEHINDDRATETLVSHFICLTIAYVAVILRFISRRINRSGYKADDWLILAALVFFTAYTSIVLLVVLRFGAAKHAILLKDPIKFAQVVIAAEVFYAPSIGLVKYSTIALYARIFTFQGIQRFLWGIGVLVTANMVPNVICIIFQCHPIKGAWDPIARVTAHCLDLYTVFVALATINVVTDVALLIAPIPHLWRLQVPKSTKLQLMGLFTIGIFVAVVSVYRIPILKQVNLVDGSYTNVDPTIWTEVEVSCAMVCASAITYRPLFNKVFGSRKSLSATPPAEARPDESPKKAARGFFTALMSTKAQGTVNSAVEKSTSDHSDTTITTSQETERDLDLESQETSEKSKSATVQIRSVTAED